MAMYQNMLVVIDPNQDDQPALRRAVYLHQRIGGKIKAFLPIYDFSYEMTTLLSPDERTAMRQGVISQRTAWIREQAKYYLEAGVPIEIKVVWHNRPFEAIIQEVIAGSHDLVLKMAHQHDRLEAVIFTPTDWHLLRKCPSPVWMVKDQPWPEGGKALVAVNLASEEPYHNALNEKLVKETLQLAEQVNHTEVHLVGAYPVTPINIAIELPEFDPSVYNDAIRGQHLLAMKALRQKFSIDEKVTHVEKGLPEEVIPDLAEHLQAGIVVLGTVGRTGLSAAFLGNTAEQVIDHLRCDLLVIKPDEYQTPVELDDEDDQTLFRPAGWRCHPANTLFLLLISAEEIDPQRNRQQNSEHQTVNENHCRLNGIHRACPLGQWNMILLNHTADSRARYHRCRNDKHCQQA